MKSFTFPKWLFYWSVLLLERGCEKDTSLPLVSGDEMRAEEVAAMENPIYILELMSLGNDDDVDRGRKEIRNRIEW